MGNSLGQLLSRYFTSLINIKDIKQDMELVLYFLGDCQSTANYHALNTIIHFLIGFLKDTGIKIG